VIFLCLKNMQHLHAYHTFHVLPQSQLFIYFNIKINSFCGFIYQQMIHFPNNAVICIFYIPTLHRYNFQLPYNLIIRLD
jgi:hypothetical protein